MLAQSRFEKQCQEFFDSLEIDERAFISLCGLKLKTFKYLFSSYCGTNTPLQKPKKLYNLFKYFKLYPVQQALQLEMGQRRTPGFIMQELNDMSDFLAQASGRELDRAWNARTRPANRLPAIIPYNAGIDSLYVTYRLSLN